MKKTLAIISLLFIALALFFSPLPLKKQSAQYKVYDCFLFYNELELLEVRLKELYDSVDYFVLVESKETFRGKPKLLYFNDNKKRFAPYLDKIIHIIVDAGFISDNPWDREHHQRSQILKGLQKAKDNDIILLSDIDEIPRVSALNKARELLASNKAKVVVFQQTMYCGRLNLLHGPWQGTVATKAWQAKKIDTKLLRKLRNMRKKHLKKSAISKITLVENGGWHFNSIGDLSTFASKLSAFSHSELDVNDDEKQKMYQKMLQLTSVPIDASFPVAIYENTDYFKKLGLISH
jgi:hypothetical protein